MKKFIFKIFSVSHLRQQVLLSQEIFEEITIEYR